MNKRSNDHLELEGFSKLEANFAELNIPRRPISVHVEATARFANESDHLVKDLDFDYNVLRDRPRAELDDSLQGMLSGLQYGSHMGEASNFANETSIDCFEQLNGQATFRSLDGPALQRMLTTIQEMDKTHKENEGGDNVDVVSRPAAFQGEVCSGEHNQHLINDNNTPQTIANERLLVFFVPLTPQKGSSFGYQLPIECAVTHNLFQTMKVNPDYLLNLLGRPDYWSPRTRWQRNERDDLTGVDYYCQYPRWNVQAQGAPLSLYVTRRIRTNLTAYIISHKIGDSSVNALRRMLEIGIASKSSSSTRIKNPFEIAVLLSSLSLEASKFHIGRLRRFMWHQVNKVDDHLAGIEINHRHHLTELTKSLQLISQQADSHLLNSDVAIITARGTHDVQTKFHQYLGTPVEYRQCSEDTIRYVISSMEKQKILLLNYKSRKDGTMSLVYNLVTQSDAANNIELARSMKHDSTSMSAIAALTMVFLPGTFTSSILSAGIFTARTGSQGISASSLWWIWIVLTIPLTIAVFVAWWLYRRRSVMCSRNLGAR